MKKGFTLIELMIVVAIIIIISTGVIMSSGVLNDQIRFVRAYQGVESMLSDARIKSLSGESFVDADDYDGDKSFSDLILPNGYIVNFKTVDGIVTVSLYADLLLHTSNIGGLDVADDHFVKSIELDESITLDLLATTKSGVYYTIADVADFSVIYTTPNAEFTVIGYPNTSLQIQINQVNRDNEIQRTKYMFMHYLFGIPELLNNPYI